MVQDGQHDAEQMMAGEEGMPRVPVTPRQAIAFGVFVVALVVFGSLIIMANLDAGMMSMDGLMRMQR